MSPKDLTWLFVLVEKKEAPTWIVRNYDCLRLKTTLQSQSSIERSLRKLHRSPKKHMSNAIFICGQ